jgi:Short C-terminal domain
MSARECERARQDELLYEKNHMSEGRWKIAARGQIDQPMPTTQNKFDLTDALQELEDARAKGLISEAEYQKLRQKVMERFG